MCELADDNLDIVSNPGSDSEHQGDEDENENPMVNFEHQDNSDSSDDEGVAAAAASDGAHDINDAELDKLLAEHAPSPSPSDGESTSSSSSSSDSTSSSSSGDSGDDRDNKRPSSFVHNTSLIVVTLSSDSSN